MWLSCSSQVLSLFGYKPVNSDIGGHITWDDKNQVLTEQSTRKILLKAFKPFMAVSMVAGK